MEREEIIRIATTIWDQILGTTPHPIIMSWGVECVRCNEWEGCATLKIKVNGFLHKGWVYISYDEGTDLYDISLLSMDKKEVVKMEEGVYFDQLGELIDRCVERGDLSIDEYARRVEEECR